MSRRDHGALKDRVACNFSWINVQREVGALWEITHYCIREHRHPGNHRCDCDVRKEQSAPSHPTYRGILR